MIQLFEVLLLDMDGHVMAQIWQAAFVNGAVVFWGFVVLWWSYKDGI